ncbi:PAS domain-containing protein [Tunicatimonas pelagia]|uniref:PAS domain-containing protein n=1 Tax=Tunicatimonas pelagia TaxID=931531 RepID=UPI002666D7F5|nr:PAS domain-containing protein [Tunicatimonas pelagia]WKN41897.1 PAS domain-containing protein [Tunicatimonas pelagia]
MNKSPLSKQFPIHCADVYLWQQNLSSQPFSSADWKMLGQFQRTYRWNVDLASLLDQSYEALVLTDPQQSIQWVSEGFITMTGYSPQSVIHRKPRILQGKATSNESKTRIRTKLKVAEPFQEVIVNYRRSGEPYRCHLSIFPMKDSDGALQHFLALEKEVA